MNLASRMESNSEPNRINISVAARRALFDQAPGAKVASRGVVDIKGKGPMVCYWVVDTESARAATLALPLKAEHEEEPAALPAGGGGLRGGKAAVGPSRQSLCARWDAGDHMGVDADSSQRRTTAGEAPAQRRTTISETPAG